VSRLTDIRPVAVELYFLPTRFRMPLKFGPEVTTTTTCARARMTVEDRSGRRAQGWGETPLSVQWTWPSQRTFAERDERMRQFCQRLAAEWPKVSTYGHPLEIGHDFNADSLHRLLDEFATLDEEPIPHLSGLICNSLFDVAMHDAYGVLLGLDTYRTYGADLVNRDLASFFAPAGDAAARFRGRYPAEFFVAQPPWRLPAWHLVGGLDPLEPADLTAEAPDDGYPTTLVDWIARDGLTCLKIKLRGNDASWDYERIVRVGRIAARHDIRALCADFNCTVTDPAYVNEILDRLATSEPAIFENIRYIEQPFPYDLNAHPIDVHSVSWRKPLFLDESAHDWRKVEQGRLLGWSGVALKTCKTQTGALLSLCWAKAHRMPLMVQDLTNPMLAQIPHVQLAAHAGTLWGIETNSMQFYPEVSKPEAIIHPGLYRRRQGMIDRSTLTGPGFGYRIGEIHRELPAPAEPLEVVASR
jgi:L-alanine-DL-glutamate epimerase-like enolase superfamily enzyme